MFEFKPPTLSVAFLILLLTGCGPAKIELWEQDKASVLASVKNLAVANKKMTASLHVLDKRIDVLERENSMLTSKVKTLEVFMAIKEVKPRVFKSQSNFEPRKKIKALNKKLDKLSAQLKPVGASSPVLAEKDVYTAAYLAFKSGRFDEALAGFKVSVQLYKAGEYTDQAYYWLGESLLALHRDKEALYAFKTVVDKYATGPKHAAALLKIAKIYQRMKHSKKRNFFLVRVLNEYPNSDSAKHARNLLHGENRSQGVTP